MELSLLCTVSLSHPPVSEQDADLESKDENKGELMSSGDLNMSERPPFKERNDHPLVRDGTPLQENHQPSVVFSGDARREHYSLKSIIRCLDKTEGIWKVKSQITNVFLTECF